MFLYQYQDSTGVSNRTLDGIRTAICAFFAWISAEGYIDKNPCISVKPIKYQRKQRESLNEYELEKLRSACSTLREKAIIELFYSTGCRVSELINIKLSDVDFDNKTIVVLGKGGKYRKVYLNAKAILATERYLESRNDDCEYLISKEKKPYGKLTKNGMERIVREIGLRANINKKIYPHLLRHTNATLGLKHGMDITQIQKILGHSNISTTMIYAEVNEDYIKIAHEKTVI